jgi:hypothetical protein
MLWSKEEFKEKYSMLQELYVQLQCLSGDKEGDKFVAEKTIQKANALFDEFHENAAVHSELYIPRQQSLKEIQQFVDGERAYYSLPIQSTSLTLPEYQLEYQVSDEAELTHLRAVLNAHCSFLRRGSPFCSVDFNFCLGPEKNTLLFTGDILQAKQVLRNLGYLVSHLTGRPDRLKEKILQDKPAHLPRPDFSA